MKEKKDRVEDALNATRAAVEEGIVVGGAALLHASKTLESLNAETDEQTFVKIVKRAVQEPQRQISFNAGLKGSVVVNEVFEKKQHGIQCT